MARNWTEAQSQAIEARDSNLLLAAAAGSGKTAVLVERIIKKITDEENPVDIDRLLVLTFTNAAAAEMRERILAALSDELIKNPDSENLSRQLTLISKASITTIHSFCNDLLRTNFNLADVDPSFRIADTTENDLLRAQVLEEVIDEMYEDDEFGDSFAQLVMNYSNVKTSKELFSLIDSIYAFCMSLPDPSKWLFESCEKFRPGKYKSFSETDWASILIVEYKRDIKRILSKYDYMLKKTAMDDGSEAFYGQLLSEKDNFDKLLNVKSYTNAKLMVSSIVFETAKSATKGSTPLYRKEVLEIRNSVKKDIDGILKSIFNLTDEEQLSVIEEMYPLMRALSEVILRFIKCFDEKKEQKNLLNFNDLEHKTLSILVDENGIVTEFAKTIKNKYDEILIDEYQDISRLQEAIFSAIKKENNLFMVGDLKQSIYRFRNTDPMLFKQKKEEFKISKDTINRKIILSKNFRSRSHILDCINYIFSKIMSDEVGEIYYNEEEKLYFGADFDENEELRTELEIIDLKELRQDAEDESVESVTAEALLAAKKISELIENGATVKIKGVERNITFKDICILMRSTKNTADVFASVLSECGIPCYSEKSGSLFDSSEVEVIMSLLRVIDNPHQDIPLLSVLRSQVYAFTTNDLANIRIKKRKVSFYEALTLKSDDVDETGKKAKAFISELCAFRERAETLSVAELIWHIYMQTGFYDCQLALKNGELKQKNLRLLFIKAEEFEKTGTRGLYNFITFIDNYRNIGGNYDAARTIGEEHNVVRIMSIHKSKGLEFPVVLLCSMGKQFNKQDLYKNVVFHHEFGYGPKYFDMQKGITYPNGAKTAIEILISNETLSEEMRILYVALTRAKERLILIGAARNLESMINKFAISNNKDEKIGSFLTGKAKSYLEWIVMCLINHPNGHVLLDYTSGFADIKEDASRWNVNIHTSIDEIYDKYKQEETEEEHEEVDSSLILKNMSWEYPFESDISIPSKITVSEMKRRVYEEEATNNFYLYKTTDLQQNRNLTGAQYGTAVHSVMERLDFKNVSSVDYINEKLSEFKDVGILSSLEAQYINAENIYAFFDSQAGEIIKSADKVLKEVTFAVNINASAFDKNYIGNAEVMLQGIIDCIAIKDDEMFIIDYKTDRVTDISEITKKYKIQLDLYAYAAEKIYKKSVKKKILYSFDKNETIEV